jgi:hypothetical protein
MAKRYDHVTPLIRDKLTLAAISAARYVQSVPDGVQGTSSLPRPKYIRSRVAPTSDSSSAFAARLLSADTHNVAVPRVKTEFGLAWVFLRRTDSVERSLFRSSNVVLASCFQEAAQDRTVYKMLFEQ